MRLSLFAAAVGFLVTPALAAPLSVGQADIVAWGDSLTLGVGAANGGFPERLAKILGCPVFNGGTEGATSKDIARHMAQNPSDDAKVIIIWAGRSDIGPPGAAEANIAAMIARVKPGQHFLVLGLLNTSFEPRGSKMYDQIAGENADLARAYGDNFVDLHPVLMTGAGSFDPTDADNVANDIPPQSVRWDPMHPNDAGYERIAEALAAIIRERGWLN